MVLYFSSDLGGRAKFVGFFYTEYYTEYYYMEYYSIARKRSFGRDTFSGSTFSGSAFSGGFIRISMIFVLTYTNRNTFKHNLLDDSQQRLSGYANR